MYRIFSTLSLFLFTTALFAQNTSRSIVNREIEHLAKEKLRGFDLSAMSQWMQAHPGQPFPQQTWQSRPDHPTAGLRSGEVVVSDDAAPESEVHAAINPIDTNNIIVSPIAQDPSNPTSPLDIPIYYTTNFGQSWQTSHVTFNPTAGAITAGGGDPVIAFDKNGKAYISWLTLGISFLSDPPIKLSLYSAYSTNKGQTWSAPVLIDEGSVTIETLLGTGNDPGALVDKQWMVCDRSNSANEGTLYVSYTYLELIDSVTSTSKIFLKKKPKTSNAFSGQPVQVHQNDYAFVQFSSIDVDQNGDIHVLFLAGNTETDMALYHALSTDGGVSFAPETQISRANFPGYINPDLTNVLDGISADRVYPCPHLRVGANPGVVYATWSADGRDQQESEGYDVWFAKSVDNGANWSVAQRINAGTDGDVEQFYPALNVNNDGRVYISYYDRTGLNGLQTAYVMAYSSDEGETFSSPVVVSTTASDFSVIGQENGEFGIGEYTQIVCAPHTAIPVWADGRSNDGDIDIYAAFLPVQNDISPATDAGVITDAFSVTVQNPARASIRLAVELNKPTPVTVRVYDEKGAVVATKIWDEMQRNSVAAEFPTVKGVYFCRVDTDFGYKLKKVVVE